MAQALRTHILGATCAVAIFAGAATLYISTEQGQAEEPSAAPTDASARQYRCPMHPTMVSDRPGDCPICGMRLVLIETDAGAHPSHTAEHASASPTSTARKLVYRSTMNPSEISDRPGKDSMGMDMVAAEVDDAPAAVRSAVEGRAPIQIPERRRQLIGVRTTAVERRPLVRTVKTVGRVTPDETRLHHVHTKVAGWVERLYANATGQLLKAGDPLLTLYSPELVASAQEYLIARRGRETLMDATLPSAKTSGDQLLASARRRLLLFDISPQQIRSLEERGEAPTAMTLRAPISGHILTRNVTQGEKIEPDLNLFDIADLSRVWVLADVYEYELPFIRLGQPATMTLSYLPGRTFEGTVTLIYPVVTDATRTVKVRLEFPNADFTLRPEMYAEVEIHSNLGEALVIPESAVISSGQRDIAFIDHGDGILEPRALTIGTRLADAYEVLDGLAEGDRVVTSGNFLIDSESKLKAALAAAGADAAGVGARHSH
jgi:membrane fusion protein, copper/silver efflux system